VITTQVDRLTKDPDHEGKRKRPTISILKFAAASRKGRNEEIKKRRIDAVVRNTLAVMRKKKAVLSVDGGKKKPRSSL